MPEMKTFGELEDGDVFIFESRPWAKVNDDLIHFFIGGVYNAYWTTKYKNNVRENRMTYFYASQIVEFILEPGGDERTKEYVEPL